MLELIKIATGVVGCRGSGRINAADAARLSEALEYRLAVQDEVNLYIDLDAVEGIEPEALATGLGGGFVDFSQLKQIRRVAVVADQDWLRSMYQMKGTLLPGVSIRVFATSEQADACDWICGAEQESTPVARAPIARWIDTDNPQVLAFEIGGDLDAERLAPLIDALEAGLADQLNVRLLVRITDLSSIESGLLEKRLLPGLSPEVLDNIERYALIGGPDWVPRMLQMFESVLPANIRHFPTGDEQAAWHWVGAQAVAD